MEPLGREKSEGPGCEGTLRGLGSPCQGGQCHGENLWELGGLCDVQGAGNRGVLAVRDSRRDSCRRRALNDLGIDGRCCNGAGMGSQQRRAVGEVCSSTSDFSC